MNLKKLLALVVLAIGTLNTYAQEEDYTSRITNANLASKDGWTLTTQGGGWSAIAGSDPSFVIEAYAGWGSLEMTTFSMKQEVTLPSGKYRAEGYAFYRYGLNANTDPSKSCADFVAGDFSSPVVTLGGETLDDVLTAYPNSMDEASRAFTNGYYKSVVEFSIESEQAISFGYEGEHVLRQSWFIAGPIKLFRTGDFDFSLYEEKLAAAVDDAEALYDKTMAPSILAALKQAVTDNNKTCSSVAEYNTATNAILAAVTAAETSVANYAIAKEILEAANGFDETGKQSYASDETIAAIQAAYTAGTLEVVTNEQKAAAAAALVTACKAQVQPANGSDMTLCIVNSNFDSGNTNGWTKDTPFGGNCAIQGGSRMEYWAGNASNRAQASFDIYQEITGLPLGAYTITADMYNSLNDEGGNYTVFSPTCGVYGSSSNEEVALVTEEGTSLKPYTTGEVLVVNGKLRIGTKNTVTPMAARWFLFDNVKLTYVRPLTDEEMLPIAQAEYEAALDEAKIVAAKTDKVSATFMGKLNAIINQCEGKTFDTPAAYTAAAEELNVAAATVNASINSYKVIEAGVVPDNSLDGWVCENTNTFHINTWSGEGNSDGSNMKTPFIENWVGKGSFLGAGRVYYQLAGLEPGEVYYAQALVRSYNEANSDAPNGPNFFINDTKVNMATEGTTFTFNNMSGIYATLGGAAVVGEDGTLTLGVEIAPERNYNWVAFKSVSIQSMEKAFAANKAEADALINTPMNGEVYNALETAANVDLTGANAEQYTTAISNLTTAIINAKESIENYAVAKQIIDAAKDYDDAGKASYYADETIAAIQAAYTAGSLVAVTDEQKTAAAAALIAACKLQTTPGSDMTALLINPSFENGFTGWTNNGMQTQGNTSFEKTGATYVEAWQPNGTKSVSQTITLPKGVYTLSAQSKARGVTSAKLFAGNEETTITIADATDTYSVGFVSDGSEITIGFEGEGTGAGSSWLCVDNFQLTFVEIAPFPITLDEEDDNTAKLEELDGYEADVTLTRTLQTGSYNTFAVPFATAIPEGWTVKELTASEFNNATGLLSLTFGDALSIEAGKPYLVKVAATADLSLAPFAGVIVSATATTTETTAVDFIPTLGKTLVTGPTGNESIAEAVLFLGANNTLLNPTVVNDPEQESSYMKGFRAYFQLKGEATQARAFSIDFGDGETTGIKAIDNGKLAIDNVVYDLQGRKVQNAAAKGMYIVNGKKVIIK